MGPETPPAPARFLLDAAAILQGLNVPASASWTTPSVMAEVRPGGRTGRRAEQLAAAGLHVEPPSEPARRRVEAAAAKAGVTGRLSEADLDILALGLDVEGLLLTDDYTVQDVAQRLDIRWQAATTRGIRKTARWRGRCAGCGRWYSPDKAGQECPVCGAEIRRKHQKDPATG